MSTYIKTIIVTTIFVSVLFSLLPKDGLGKYCNLLAGLIILSVVVSPIQSLFRNRNSFTLDFRTEELTMRGNDYLLDAVEETLAKKIKEKLKHDTNETFSVSVSGMCDEAGTLTGIYKIKIKPYTETYAKSVASYVGIEAYKVEALT